MKNIPAARIHSLLAGGKDVLLSHLIFYLKESVNWKGDLFNFLFN